MYAKSVERGSSEFNFHGVHTDLMKRTETDYQTERLSYNSERFLCVTAALVFVS